MSIVYPILGADISSETKVLFVLGEGRSGSTLLGNVLGEVPGFFHCGELYHVWQFGLLKGELCACGQRVRECEVWRSVFDRAFPGLIDDRPRVQEIVRLHQTYVRTRDTVRIRTRLLNEEGPLRRYADLLADLYRSIADVTQSTVVIDTSKRPAHAALLLHVPGIQPFFVHLVRDPRANAYSWGRLKRLTDGGGNMPRMGVGRSTRKWVETHVMSELSVPRSSVRTVRYEDFVQHPEATVRAIVGFAGETGGAAFEGSRVTLRDNHTIHGNPSKWTRGEVDIRSDDEWIRAQSRSHRYLVTAIALPMLMKYRYPMVVRDA